MLKPSSNRQQLNPIKHKKTVPKPRGNKAKRVFIQPIDLTKAKLPANLRKLLLNDRLHPAAVPKNPAKIVFPLRDSQLQLIQNDSRRKEY